MRPCRWPSGSIDWGTVGRVGAPRARPRPLRVNGRVMPQAYPARANGRVVAPCRPPAASGGLTAPDKMGKRRKTREVALQFLYQLDLNSDDDPTPHEVEFWARHPVDADTRVFGDALVRGTKVNQAKIDQMISQFTEHWDLQRMAVVDRNILRLAVYELLWTADVPPKVAINEAIEIAKKFGTKESSRFINGVLDRIHKELRPIS